MANPAVGFQGNYTYPGILTTNVFFKPSLDSPAISDIATIDMGISYRKVYNTIPILSKILKPYAGCIPPNPTAGPNIGNVTLETKEFEVRMAWCKDDFSNQLASQYNNLAQEWYKTGNESFNPANTPIQSILTTITDDALRRDVFRRVSFAKQASANADYNQIDGLWTRLIATSGGSNYCVVRAGGALGATPITVGATALAALQACWDQSNALLKSVPPSQLTFWVTGSIYDSYVKTLQGPGSLTSGYTVAAAFDNIQKGVQGVYFNGIPVRPVRLWDLDLQDPANPLFGVTANLILLTTKINHIVGVENAGDLNKIEGWYDRTTRTYRLEGDMKFGYQYLHCDFQTIAY